jgi:hypothetical protein
MGVKTSKAESSPKQNSSRFTIVQKSVQDDISNPKTQTKHRKNIENKINNLNNFRNQINLKKSFY